MVQHEMVRVLPIEEFVTELARHVDFYNTILKQMFVRRGDTSDQFLEWLELVRKLEA